MEQKEQTLTKDEIREEIYGSQASSENLVAQADKLLNQHSKQVGKRRISKLTQEQFEQHHQKARAYL